MRKHRKKQRHLASIIIAPLICMACIFAASTAIQLLANIYTLPIPVPPMPREESDRPTTEAAQNIPEEKPQTADPMSIPSPSTTHLDDFFSQFGSNIGIFYKNLDTGFTYTYNGDTVFFGASLNKANHALHAFVAAERGYINMHSIHTFTANDWWGGTGIIRFMPAGTRFTTRELLHHSIVYSDNIAFRMLARYMENSGFSYHDFVIELGADPDFILSRYSNNTTAADTALWFEAIYDYITSDSRYAHYLLDNLLNTAVYSHPYFTRGGRFGGDSDVNVQFIHADYPVAQKYGWFNGAFNTAGIVYAPSPFILVIVSNMDEGAHALFEDISELMSAFNG